MKFTLFFSQLISCWFAVCILTSNVSASTVTVAVASNMQSVVEDLKLVFEKDSGTQVVIITGSSGKLSAQIENGAPFDIFLSADMDYPRNLFKEGLALEEPKVYTYGILILWSMNDLDLSKGLNILTDKQIKKIAVATPKLAPYGREAVNAIKYFQLYPQVESKIVYGENISQVNQFIATRAADIGFTSESTVMAGSMKGKGVWSEVDPTAYDPIAQGAVILKRAEHNADAHKFYEFLFSPEVRSILKENGYRNDAP